jgi:signal transduction histidine kinase
MLRSTSLRLSAIYTGAFALSVIALGAITLITTRTMLDRQFDVQINTEAQALSQEFKTQGLKGVLEAVRQRDRRPGALIYGIVGPDGAPLAGRLAGRKPPSGWGTTLLTGAGGELEHIRILTLDLPSGYKLVVGNDDASSQALERAVVHGFAWAFGGVVVLGVLGGYGLSHGVHRRLGNMRDAAEGIIEGDLTRRISTRGSEDDLDRLAATFNRMLDKLEALMSSVKQVSDDIAHDLRTPLTRLRQRLEATRSLKTPADYADAIDGALGDLDATLETFEALLRIAQVESGSRRTRFEAVDLAIVVQTVIDDFAPHAEDIGQTLKAVIEAPMFVEGDRRLLAQMLINLLENAFRHAGRNASVEVGLRRTAGGATLTVTDNGPGVPPEERTKVLDRFYRLEQSRTTPGNGLGLALVSAIAKLHGGTVELSDAVPGLQVAISIPVR